MRILATISLWFGLALSASPASPQIQPRPTRPPDVAVPTKDRLVGLNSLAHELAMELSGLGYKKVAFLDFIGPDRTWSPFSSWLAEEFSMAVRDAGFRIEVVDRAQLLDRLGTNSLSQEDALFGTSLEKFRAANSLGADTLIEGTYGPAEHGVGVTLNADHVSDPEYADYEGFEVATIRGKVPFAREFHTMPQLPCDVLWPSKRPLIPGQGGVGSLACTYCPNPQFSAEASHKKLQGTVLLDVVVTAEGSVTQINLVKRPGSGLDERAVECVKEWRFRPATDADGKPVPIRTPLEAIFRLN